MTTTTQAFKNSPMTLPSDLAEDARTRIGDSLLPLTADAVALYFKTKNYHWHISGPHFKEYHELLDQNAEQIFPMIDVLAERARKLGQTALHSISQAANVTRVPDDTRDFVEPHEMLRQLLDDNSAFVAHMRETHTIVDEAGDVATASLLENFIDESERRVWFLYETIVRSMAS